ncbi:MAG: 16S rRNA (cytidine(1402)-2'-O)-methyltransferase [Peptococcaceae bacterium]|nr:16S rRNA (cytidine(1402)-2'-O)-methyltransferase [Peptococcaceae bacterium]
MQATDDKPQGMLYLCATPIGNLDDITLRVLHALEDADIIYCEDTRNSLKLLRHFEITKPLASFHDHSPASRITRILDDVRAGKQVCVISDAGMPVISDPGFDLVNAMREAGLPYTVLPGASASLTALVLSGIAADRFLFEGFLPRKKKDLDARLDALAHETATAILYESPHRLTDTLAALAARWPDRELACVREISKRFEEVVRASCADVLAHFQTNAPRGEFVLILAGASASILSEEDAFAAALTHARALVADGTSTNAAAKDAAARFNLPKRRIYQALLEND